jgi:minor extracellular serine protease Vpr
VNRWNRRIVVVSLLAALVAALVVPAGAGGRATDRQLPAQQGHDYVTVKLADPATASYVGGIQNLQRTKPQPGRKLDLSSAAAGRYRTHLAQRRQDFRQFLQSQAPRAEVVREFSVVFNGLTIKLNGESQATLSRGPGVAAVNPSFLVRPAMNVSPGLINAPALWTAVGGQSNAGIGIKVGVIDTGIDLRNPFLADTGYPTVSQTDACQPLSKPGGVNTSKKVIVCRVFYSGVAPGAISSFTLLAFDHGTHVSGTVAGNGNTTATVSGVTITGLSGIAPKAWLGDYNVFPGFGAGYVAFGGSAFSHDIIAALEAAVADGMDVVNMSLGGGVQGPHDTLADATNATVDAGVIAAVAAGNSGPGDGTVESPGSAEQALTAGASTNPHFVGIPVTVGSTTIGAALGDFNNFGVVTATYTVTNPANGCTAITTNLTGKIALIDRGVCTFTTKVRNAQNAGAVGVLVVNNVAGDPTAMGADGTTPAPTIPAAMLGKNEGNAIKPSGTATVNGTTPQEFLTANADIIAGFSSRGPAAFTYSIKPDATAPGVNILSSVFDQGFAFFQGTSMATPHLAGSSAVLLQRFRALFGTGPALPYPDIVKSAIVNNAKRPVTDHVNGTAPTGVLTRGGGRVDLQAAMNAAAAFGPASVSFGLQKGSAPINTSRTITVFNTGASQRTYAVSVTSPAPGVSITVSTGSVTVPAGGTTTFSVNLAVARNVPSGDYEGDIEVAFGLSTMRLPWWVRIARGP